jgi:hypothetical protein
MRVPIPAAMTTMSSVPRFPAVDSAAIRCTNRRAPVARIGIIAVLVLALAGCSALRIGYATAPDVLFWWFDAYVDFSGAQIPRAREALARWFQWHRRTQVPDYAALLARVRPELLADTTPERTCGLWREVQARVRTGYEQAVPAMAELVVTLTPEQVAHVEARYAKTNGKFREEYLQPDPAERRRAAVKRAIDRAESVYGSLDDAQRERIARNVERSPYDPERQFAERRARQQDALAQLRSLAGAPPDRAQAALLAFGHRFEQSPREGYQRYQEQLTRYLCTTVAEFHNGTTPAQRRAAAERFAGWESDLRAIAAESNP